MAKSKTTPNGPTGILSDIPSRDILERRLLEHIAEGRRLAALIRCRDALEEIDAVRLAEEPLDVLEANLEELRELPLLEEMTA